MPVTDSKPHKMLVRMLRGERLTAKEFYELNVNAPGARMCELRELGWPVSAFKVPHPIQTGEEFVAYGFDAHFLHWMAQNKLAHPAMYPFNNDRGKYRYANKEETEALRRRGYRTEEGKADADSSF